MTTAVANAIGQDGGPGRAEPAQSISTAPGGRCRPGGRCGPTVRLLPQPNSELERNPETQPTIPRPSSAETPEPELERNPETPTCHPPTPVAAPSPNPETTQPTDPEVAVGTALIATRGRT